MAAYPDCSPDVLGECFGRSQHAVVSQARRLLLPTANRRCKQSTTRAEQNRSVNVHFFDTVTPDVAFVLGYVWATGTVKTSPRHVLLLRCPVSEEAGLLTVL